MCGICVPGGFLTTHKLIILSSINRNSIISRLIHNQATLAAWRQTSLGRSMLEAELEALQKFLPALNGEIALQVGLVFLTILFASYLLSAVVCAGRGIYVAGGLLAATLLALAGIHSRRVWGLYFAVLIGLLSSVFLVGIPILHVLTRIDWNSYRVKPRANRSGRHGGRGSHVWPER